MLLPRGFGATPEELQDQFTSFQQHIHGLVLAIKLAESRGDETTAASLRAQLRSYAQQMAVAAAALNKVETPSHILQIIADTNTDVAVGLGKAVSLLPSISTGLLAVAGIAAVFFFWGMRPRGRRA